ncbi:Cell division cycle-associated 7-like protein [Dichanthelium oligosanthes]|uniref:Cell division cycle-associated 7-like protein n=1 Tax=Dichanthelium oligosanthes TaxID=888268 RepID=A0A1E5WE43_9POAL|nr:Cell division cycle-associated 7-like protein [Dichanthelium oligosanthes]
MAASPERNGCLSEERVEVLEPQPLEVIAPEVKAKKRNPAPGVRVVGRRIYDPENGKTCHQCRQKTTDFAAACKQVKKKGPCPIKYCRKCLLNRYGENAEEAAGKEDWICPKCRGICNCSFCRKKKGEMPTGIMAHIAKASGCTSVHDLLEKGSEVVAAAQAILKVNGSDKQGTRSSRETDAADEVAAEWDESVGIDLNTVPGDEGDENIGVDLNALPSVCIKKKQKLQHSLMKNPADERSHGGDSGEQLLRDESPKVLNNNIALPRGTPVTNIAGAQLDDEDIGAAVQFLEFCRTFAEEKELKERLKDNMDKTMLSPNEAAALSSEENKDLVSQIKEAQEVKRAAINDMAAIEKQGGLWTKPLIVEKGLAYWKLDGYCDNTAILLQEHGHDELLANKDKWFMFTEDEEKAIEEHIATG